MANIFIIQSSSLLCLPVCQHVLEKCRPQRDKDEHHEMCDWGERNVDYQETHVSPTSKNLRRTFQLCLLKKK